MAKLKNKHCTCGHILNNEAKIDYGTVVYFRPFNCKRKLDMCYSWEQKSGKELDKCKFYKSHEECQERIHVEKRNLVFDNLPINYEKLQESTRIQTGDIICQETLLGYFYHKVVLVAKKYSFIRENSLSLIKFPIIYSKDFKPIKKYSGCSYHVIREIK